MTPSWGFFHGRGTSNGSAKKVNVFHSNPKSSLVNSKRRRARCKVLAAQALCEVVAAFLWRFPRSSTIRSTAARFGQSCRQRTRSTCLALQTLTSSISARMDPKLGIASAPVCGGVAQYVPRGLRGRRGPERYSPGTFAFVNATASWINTLLPSSIGPIKVPLGACATATRFSAEGRRSCWLADMSTSTKRAPMSLSSRRCRPRAPRKPSLPWVVNQWRFRGRRRRRLASLASWNP